MAWLAVFAGIVGIAGYFALHAANPVASSAAVEAKHSAADVLRGRDPPPETPVAATALSTPPALEHASPFTMSGVPTIVTEIAVRPEADDSTAHPASSGQRSTGAPVANAKPTDQELHVAMSRVSVTVYSTEWCPVCDRARAWFRANGISFEERDVEKSESARRAQLSLNPKGGVPTIDIDGEVMAGFGDEHVKAALRRAAQRRARRF